MNVVTEALNTIDKFTINNKLVHIIGRLTILASMNPSELSSLLDRIEARIDHYERNLAND